MDEKSLPVRRKGSTEICRIKERHLTICFFEEEFRRNPLLRFHDGKANPFLLESMHFETHI